jgi:nucleotide-binding universal stress UspA family protein
VLHVLPLLVPAEGPGLGAPLAAFDATAATEAAQGELQAFVADAVGDAVERVTCETPVGSTVPTIADTAATWRPDLVVMGTHGRGGLTRAVLGSVAESVLRRVSCPVLTVPPHVGPEAAGHPRFDRILCAVDFSEASVAGVECALALARMADARVVLLHVVEDVVHLPMAPWTPGLSVRREAIEREVAERLARLVPADAAEWCHAETMIADGQTGPRILDAARQACADLVVLGVHGWHPLNSLVFGSTARDVLQSAACPVLTTRPRAAAAA